MLLPTIYIGKLYCIKKKCGEKVQVIRRTASEWPKLAYILGIDYSVVKNIDYESRFKPEKAWAEALHHWMEEQTRLPVNWRTFIEALEEAEFNSLAMDLKLAVAELTA